MACLPDNRNQVQKLVRVYLSRYTLILSCATVLTRQPPQSACVICVCHIECSTGFGLWPITVSVTLADKQHMQAALLVMLLVDSA